ncbi:aspartokinase [Intestinibaculum porci]|jgi:aspartate kinase|uniref:Aspartokinase n=1 Tax=Intestinibaculum porci TaxID=2487118 RepID=A0A3G9JPZ8_9FIRM|nr:aspartate kinase [Intestinibaculum porci]BBH27073.1 aspartokinase [Intestinibaculum porci]HAN57587.1 aspartate kinase [Erysipelotrichaceae bacterium]
MLKVVKFGGSSLADATQFKKVYNIIKADESRRFVVPSAPGKRNKEDTKVTDLLILAFSHRDEADFEEIFKTIRGRYQAIIDELGLDYSLDEEFKTIHDAIKAGVGFDYVVSRGEYLNGLLLANYLGFDFIDAKDVICIDESGNYDAKKTDPLLTAELEKHEYAVIPGFYGIRNDDSGEIQAFSRGGSDVTGSIVAKCANANLYENWTDVSGFLIADPRIVKKPLPIETITYAELRELSYMGASVLHENSIFPVRSAGIPINIKNTNRPQDPGTLIVESTVHRPAHIITGIAGKKGFATVSIEKDMMNSEIGFGRKVLQVFEEYGLSFEHMPSGIDTMTIIVNTKEFIKHEQDIISGIHRAVHPDKIDLESDLALIAVVGRGMKANRGTAAKLFTALAKEKINVKMIDQGSSELNIIVGVRNVYFEDALRAIYNAFIVEEEEEF